VKVQRIHGNRSQSQRTEALAGFKSGRYQVLVATDIAARGIDVTALGHVINFDVPGQAEDYIHRVGRTARAELTGSAFTLVAPEEEGSVRDIERAIGKRLPRVTLPDFDYQARPAAARAEPARGGYRDPRRSQNPPRKTWRRSR
jgi:ATP-dependent RNA helicase RhlE